MRRSRKVFGTLGLALALLWGAGFYAFLRDVDAFAPPPETQKKLDAIVVLTGGTNRIDAGFTLIEHGAARKLFISGVYRGVDLRQLLAHWKSEPQSSLDCCVAIGSAADNTAGNAVESIDWLRREGFTSLYLVTSNYHMRRALLEFSTLAPALEIIPYPVAPEHIEGVTLWRLLIAEYTKLLATHLRRLI